MMDVNAASQLLGGLSPQRFMRRHWQRKPLLIRAALPDLGSVLQPAALFELAAREQVESRLVMGPHGSSGWGMRHGPFPRRALPALKRPNWTLLVQGVDLHVDAARLLLDRFRFVPEARLDDLMVSYASDGGGVGPHFDSYDVFLLQVRGSRRWRIGRQSDLSLMPGMPMKILRRFEPEQEFVLDAGDMLYLPPRYAHDGIAIGACMTYSVGFKAPRGAELARELLQRMAEELEPDASPAMYRDRQQAAVASAAEIPPALREFGRRAIERALRDPFALDRALGEYLTEPKAAVWFDADASGPAGAEVRLDRRTRMMYDARHVFINGESVRAGGRDAVLMRRLADARCLSASDTDGASAAALALLGEWREAGWLHGA